MSLLLTEIEKVSPEGARVLKKAGLCTDSEIRSLSREDLRDLMPDAKYFKHRRNILEIIQKTKPIGLVLQEMKAFVPDDCIRAAVTEHGVLADYLKILKEMKTQISNIQEFCDAHIDLLENINKKQPYQEPRKGSFSKTTTSTCSIDPDETYRPQKDVPYHTASPGFFQGIFSGLPSFVYTPSNSTPCNSQQKRVKCGIIVAGKTFNAHLQLLENVKNPNLDLVWDNLEENPDNLDYQVIIVFCPISSRPGTDAEAAMCKVTGDKPVILVLMEHTREAKNSTPMITWDDFPNVVLHAYVFYHDTAHGLLQCQQNNLAASKIQMKLLEYSNEISQYTGANARHMSAGRSNSYSRFAGNDKGSNSGSRFYQGNGNA